ncbi:hypothetical protein JB92DRAFT_3280129 [Gautieria morchelliformis]|nr:hypothetical protein JB92DRAFT_3280129 [Gautieria morchelliformis]
MAVPSHSFFRLRTPPFYALDDELSLLLAVASGLQHALAMLAGKYNIGAGHACLTFASSLSLHPATSAYLVSASLVGAVEILSLVKMSLLNLLARYYLGTGLMSVIVGTGFSMLSTAKSIFDATCSDGTCSSTTLSDGTVVRHACPEAYGKLLSTALVCSFLEMFLSFVCHKAVPANDHRYGGPSDRQLSSVPRLHLTGTAEQMAVNCAPPADYFRNIPPRLHRGHCHGALPNLSSSDSYRLSA